MDLTLILVGLTLMLVGGFVVYKSWKDYKEAARIRRLMQEGKNVEVLFDEEENKVTLRVKEEQGV